MVGAPVDEARVHGDGAREACPPGELDDPVVVVAARIGESVDVEPEALLQLSLALDELVLGLVMVGGTIIIGDV